MLLSCLLYPVGPAALILMPMIVGGLIDTYGFSEQQAGNIAALEGLGLVFASILAAAWIRRVSWVKALTVSFAAYAALNVVSANIQDYPPLLVLRCLTGLAGGSVFAVTVAALGDDLHAPLVIVAVRVVALAAPVEVVIQALPGVLDWEAFGDAVVVVRRLAPEAGRSRMCPPVEGPFARLLAAVHRVPLAPIQVLRAGRTVVAGRHEGR